MESSRLLPIGSVITLTDAEKKLMVIGTEVEREDDENIYDYVGVPFPEGYIDSEIMFLFMHDDIESIDFGGFINSEVQAYRSRLNELADEK